MPQIGKVLIISGIVMLTVGVFLVFFSDKIKWFGNLPLDFSYKSDSTRFYAPIGSMILLSVILSIVANIFYRLVIFLPFIKTSPLSGFMFPTARLKVVVFPAPLGPIKPTTSPGFTNMETLFTINLPLIERDTF